MENNYFSTHNISNQVQEIPNILRSNKMLCNSQHFEDKSGFVISECEIVFYIIYKTIRNCLIFFVIILSGDGVSPVRGKFNEIRKRFREFSLIFFSCLRPFRTIWRNMTIIFLNPSLILIIIVLAA